MMYECCASDTPEGDHELVKNCVVLFTALLAPKEQSYPLPTTLVSVHGNA